MHVTVFSKIINGDIPCHKLYEDTHVLAFLDVAPLSEGHTLVIPKEAKAHLHELSDESAAALGRVLPRICRAVMKATGAQAYNLLQNNGSDAHQEVMHVHLHIIPKIDGAGLGLLWKPGKLDSDRARVLADRVRASL
ncbi:MAG: HIT family protein [Phycisphaerae bacterium]|nr:HIT family protein [Phycisphaerae bacterium]